MSENGKKEINFKPKTNIKKKFMDINWDRPKITLLFCTIVLLIPIIFFVYILLSAYTNTGKPILGNRFKGDLDPAVQSSEIKSVQTSIGNMSFVNSVKVELKIATVRIYVVVDSTVAKEDFEKIAQATYDEAIKVWPVEQYFTVINGTQKQYDLEIHIINATENFESEDFAYYILVKNSAMEEPRGQLVSEPINPELAANLRETADERNNPTKTEDEEGDEVDAPGGLNEDEGEGE